MIKDLYSSYKKSYLEDNSSLNELRKTLQDMYKNETASLCIEAFIGAAREILERFENCELDEIKRAEEEFFEQERQGYIDAGNEAISIMTGRSKI